MFKVGDKVRCIDADVFTINAGLIKGETYTVLGVSKSNFDIDEYFVQLTKEQVDNATGWYAERFELVESAPEAAPAISGVEVFMSSHAARKLAMAAFKIADENGLSESDRNALEDFGAALSDFVRQSRKTWPKLNITMSGAKNV